MCEPFDQTARDSLDTGIRDFHHELDFLELSIGQAEVLSRHEIVLKH